jgi:uncharacterized protein
MNLEYSVAGLLVGFLVGMTGVGGGALMAPLLILVFGFNPAVAVGTDLWFAAITKTAGSLIHRRVGSPDWQIIRTLMLGSLPACLVTLLVLALLHGGKLESEILMYMLGCALLLVAIITPLKGRMRGAFMKLKGRLGPGIRGHQKAAIIIGGAAIGCLVTVTSVGAGALVALLLMLVYPLRLDAKSLVGTDIVHAVPLALVAAIGHSWLGNVNVPLLSMLLLGSIPGIIGGSLLAGRVNEVVVRSVLAAMLAISGVKMLAA